MPIVRIPGAGDFERTTVNSPWSHDEIVTYRAIAIEPSRTRGPWISMLITTIPGFVLGLLLGYLTAL